MSATSGGAASDTKFAGSIPELYDRLLVPLIFAPAAEDLARRAAALAPTQLLEVAAGTGVVTRALARMLPPDATLVASDLNPAMLERAAANPMSRPVRWLSADAQQLPFDDGSFDLVVCQFGVMFFADKARAHAEARRVLRAGGALLFNVWDRIETNDFADVVTDALAERYPHAAPRFLARTPHGHADVPTLLRDLAAGGWSEPPVVETWSGESLAPSAQQVAEAYCQGTPLRHEIEALDPAGLAAATQACTEALARRFGAGQVSGRIQARVVCVRRAAAGTKS